MPAFLLKFLPALKSPKTVISIVMLVIFGLLVWDHQRIKDKLSESEHIRRTLAGYLVECQDANAQNLNTVRSLEGAVNRLSAACRVSTEDAAEAAVEAARREAETRLELADTINELERLRNAEPSCEAIAAMDIGAACPAALERLRERARADSQD